MDKRLSRRVFFGKGGGAVLTVWALLGVYVYAVRAQEAAAGDTQPMISASIDAN